MKKCKNVKFSLPTDKYINKINRTLTPYHKPKQIHKKFTLKSKQYRKNYTIKNMHSIKL